jgi:hypothetical protein
LVREGRWRGQGQDHGCAARRVGREGDGASVCFDDSFDDCEAEACSGAASRWVAAREAFERGGCDAVGEPRPFVGDV